MKFSDLPGSLLMLRPACFGFNAETAASNPFQQSTTVSPERLAYDAVEEFDQMVEQLRSMDVNVHVIDDNADVMKPDAVFPNNWISFHPGGQMILYPMMSPNRRQERRMDIIDLIRENYVVHDILDLTSYENENIFLEGTGSLVFDYTKGRVFANISLRTNGDLVKRVGEFLGLKPVIFHAVDDNNIPIYHTNVIMSVGKNFAVLCIDAIRDEAEQEIILGHLAHASRKVVAISMEQARRFAGNIYEVLTMKGDALTIISDNALKSLLPGQVHALSEFSELLPVKIDTIERYGGGSVRCMVAGIHLPKRN